MSVYRTNGQLHDLVGEEIAKLFTCNYVVSVRKGFLFLLVLEMVCVILLWHSLGLPYHYFLKTEILQNEGNSIKGSFCMYLMCHWI